jgi:acylphosphatase
VIRGRVQGVFFRDSIRRLADESGVSGWARNTGEGTVEAVFEGPPDSVEQLVSFTRLGPPDAHVEDVRVFEEKSEGLAGFSIR